MVSFKGIAILSILALGKVNASTNTDDDCDDDTTLSTAGHRPTGSASTSYSSTTTIITPSSAASHHLDDVEDADEIRLSATAQATGSASTYSSTTTTLIIPNSATSHIVNDSGDDDEVRLYLTTTLVTSIVSVSSSASSPVSTPGSQGGHAPKSCKAVAPPPAGRTCGVEGYINQADQSGRWPPQKKNNLKECATLCFSGPDCTAFRYRQDGNCQIFTQEFSSYGFNASTSGSYWYQKECFECSDDGTVLDIDFRDNDVSDWCLTDDVDDSFELDIQTADGLSSLRVRELATEGEAQVEYLTEFQVDAGTYEMVFNVRSNLPVGRQTGVPDTDFKLLTFYVSTNDRVIFETIPVDGVWNGGEGWYKFSSKFVVQRGEEGAATLSFAVHASGSQLDWYLGYLYINSV
ncbi:hypothetical protein B0J13DRAFT_558502 [Dactylonectria estremocensis]|uniref:Apple domain-containing protein n=1 Tax=Dactylonectria estremocensis TaxID=1079267 RepID=A0A9P9IZM9_9HYPO|nr:hypothetical protein B0J13DRAFT_558502 [Dactylonectria estremocensis]